MLVKVLYQIRRHYVFKDLTENTGEGDRSVICSRCFITFFEDVADLGTTRLCVEFAGLNGAFKNDLICALWSPAGKGLTSCLSFVMYNCDFVTFPLVSWVRCVT